MSLTYGKISLFCLSLTIVSSLALADNHESAPATASDTHAGAPSSNLKTEHQAPHAAEHKAEHGTDFFPPKPVDATVATTPAKTELKSPEFFSSIKGNEVVLNWSTATGADSYHVQVATDANFKWLIANEFFVKATTFQVKSLEAGKHYFWRVAGMKSDNDAGYVNGPFAASMFTTAAQ